MGYLRGEHAVVYEGTVIADGCTIGDHAVVGKQPVLSPRSTAARDPLPPLELGPATVVSAGAIVFAGTTVGARVAWDNTAKEVTTPAAGRFPIGVAVEAAGSGITSVAVRLDGIATAAA